MNSTITIWDLISNPTFWSALEALGTLSASFIALFFGLRALNNQRRERHYEFIHNYFPTLRKATLEKYEHNKRVINGELNPLYHYGEIRNLNDYGRLGAIKYIDIDLFRSMTRVMTTLNSLIESLNECKSRMIVAIKEQWTEILSDETIAGDHRGIGEKSLSSSVFDNSISMIFSNNLEAIKDIFEETMKERFKDNENYSQNPYPEIVKERFVSTIQGLIKEYNENLNKINELNESEVKNIIIPRLGELISNPP